MLTRTTSKYLRVYAAGILTLVLLGAGLALHTATSSAAPPPGDDCGQQCQEALADAREATALYHQESNALGDGFIPDQECVQAPGAGGMGFHYVNFSRMQDTSVSPEAPEVLLYEAQADGSRRLVGVEYLAPVIVNGSPWFGPGPPPQGQYNAAPQLFGRAFNGPMPGHNPQMPWHYDLHVWIWRHNPAGMFVPFNPKVICR